MARGNGRVARREARTEGERDDWKEMQFGRAGTFTLYQNGDVDFVTRDGRRATRINRPRRRLGR